MEKYIENINKELKNKGLTRLGISKKVGISKASVNNYLLGHRIMPLDVFLKIVDEFDIDIREVLEPKYFIESKVIPNEQLNQLTQKIQELEIRLDECRRNSAKTEK